MVGVALRIATIPSVVLMCRSFVRSVVSATISSVVVVSVVRIYVARICVARVYVVARRFSSVVVVSVARIYVVRICVARIYVVRIYVVARRLCRCRLVDGRFEVEVWTKSKSGRSLDGTPVGVKGVLAAGASKPRGAVRCAGSHLSRNCVSPTCISSMRRSWIPSRAWPSLTILFILELAFSDANCISLIHWERCSNFRSQPSMAMSKSLAVTMLEEEWNFPLADCLP